MKKTYTSKTVDEKALRSAAKSWAFAVMYGRQPSMPGSATITSVSNVRTRRAGVTLGPKSSLGQRQEMSPACIQCAAALMCLTEPDNVEVSFCPKCKSLKLNYLVIERGTFFDMTKDALAVLSRGRDKSELWARNCPRVSGRTMALFRERNVCEKCRHKANLEKKLRRKKVYGKGRNRGR